MEKLTDKQIKRQDYVDNEIYRFIKSVNPTDIDIEWDIEMIGAIRDVIRKWLVERMKITNEQDFYPYIGDQDGF